MDHEEILNRLNEAVNNKDLDEIASLLTDDFQFDSGIMPPMGRQKWLAQTSVMFAAMPDLSFNLGYVESDGNKARGYNELTGTHTGPLDLSMMDGPVIPATGTHVEAEREYGDVTFKGDKISYIKLHPEEGTGFGGVLAALGVEMGG